MIDLLETVLKQFGSAFVLVPINVIAARCSNVRFWSYALRMPAHRLPFHTLFARAVHGWKKQQGGQTMT